MSAYRSSPLLLSVLGIVLTFIITSSHTAAYSSWTVPVQMAMPAIDSFFGTAFILLVLRVIRGMIYALGQGFAFHFLTRHDSDASSVSFRIRFTKLVLLGLITSAVINLPEFLINTVPIPIANIGFLVLALVSYAYLGLGLLLAPSICLSSSVGVFDCITNSLRLSKGNRRFLLGDAFVLMLLAILPNLIIDILPFLGVVLPTRLLSITAALLSGPIYMFSWLSYASIYRALEGQTQELQRHKVLNPNESRSQADSREIFPAAAVAFIIGVALGLIAITLRPARIIDTDVLRVLGGAGLLSTITALSLLLSAHRNDSQYDQLPRD